MTVLDDALVVLRQDITDAQSQSKFYDLFLNWTFYVPTLDPASIPDGPQLEEGQVLPLVMESDGHDYLMLFDTKERLVAWAEAEVPHVEVPGYFLAATSIPELRWALNVGTEYSKEFVPDEIAWLKDVVEKNNADAQKPGQE